MQKEQVCLPSKKIIPKAFEDVKLAPLKQYNSARPLGCFMGFYRFSMYYCWRLYLFFWKRVVFGQALYSTLFLLERKKNYPVIQFSDDAYLQIKQMLIRAFPYVSRELTQNEKDRLIEAGLLDIT